jgi:hypothetical protein
MPASLSQAHGEILALLATALPCDLPVAWPDMARAPGFPPASGNWARVTISDTGEESPPTIVSSPGNRRTKTIGLLTVQLFTLAGDGQRQARTIAQTILSAFRGASTAGGVSFRNERANAIGPDGVWWATNVLVEYVYSTLQ